MVKFSVKATDNSGQAPLVTVTPPSGSWFAVGTNQVIAVATDAAGNSATNTFNVVVIPGEKCGLIPTPGLSPDNWSFELGLVGWHPTGSAFEFQPVLGDGFKVRRISNLKQQMENKIGGDYWQDLQFRVGSKGSYWIGTADNYAVPQGYLFDSETENEALTGELQSKQFKIEHPFITFLVGGTDDSARLRVELLIATNASSSTAIQVGGSYYERHYSSTGHGRELMRRQTWAVGYLVGRTALIRIVDDSSTGHLNVDDFRFVDVTPSEEKITFGGKSYPSVVAMEANYYDWDSPIWGLADMHTHPMSHLGFAESVMFGKPDGNIETALGDCTCMHGSPLENGFCGNFLRWGLEMGTDEKGNDPHREGWDSNQINGNTYGHFRHWPIFSTSTHQQMWHEWTKRAYDGGLRVMVALCVNNAMLGSAAQGPGELYDRAVGDKQIDAMIEFAARHSDFMEIAYDPYQMRDIVRRNKLAVILGSELDDIGDFARNKLVSAWNNPISDPDKTAVRNELDRLYNKGLRYIFPIHLVNNQFGGTPVCNIMLNMASRFLNHEPIQVEPAAQDEHIRYWYPTNFDIGAMLKGHELELAAGITALPVVLPVLPALADVVGIAPPGGGAAIGAGLFPMALLGAVGALPGAIQAIPPEVWPIDHHYPVYPGKAPGQAPWGHHNARGFTPLGRFAVREMMKRGMMIDVDHMSKKTIDEMFQIAEENFVGYPLNSGHNSFRALAEAPHENHRTVEQMNHIRESGGIFGVGYENSSVASLGEVWLKDPLHSNSQVDNNCGGTSKSVSQIYMYALETMGGRGVAFGTDMNGLIAGPGPRFGPNSDLGNESPWGKAERIRNQANGVLYTPRYGRPIVGPAFIGKGRDPKKVVGFGSEEHLDGDMKPSYAYSQEQTDFFPALNIFRYLRERANTDGWDKARIYQEVDKVMEVVDDHYCKDCVKDMIIGLINGSRGWPLNSSQFVERLAKVVYQMKELDFSVPDDLNSFDLERLFSLCAVWEDYERSFGGNVPLKRCKTGVSGSDYKDWDINFEGVAHYGLLPDLVQDMSNVGMEKADLTPLFQSAEDFALMWTKTVKAAAWAGPHIEGIFQFTDAEGGRQLEVTIDDANEEIVIEETDDLGNPSSWHLSSGEAQLIDGKLRVISPLDTHTPQRFFRVRKK